jgi:hypothetical protein
MESQVPIVEDASLANNAGNRIICEFLPWATRMRPPSLRNLNTPAEQYAGTPYPASAAVPPAVPTARWCGRLAMHTARLDAAAPCSTAGAAGPSRFEGRLHIEPTCHQTPEEVGESSQEHPERANEFLQP